MIRLKVGDTIRHALPASEVCMHMHVAGAIRPVTVLEHGAQIHNADMTPFSFPVTWGEAGIYRDDLGPYISNA